MTQVKGKEKNRQVSGEGERNEGKICEYDKTGLMSLLHSSDQMCCG